MKEYQAIAKKTICFELFHGNESVGRLTSNSWFSFNALIELANNSNYQVTPKGFFGTTIEVKDEYNVLLKFKMNWNGDIVIYTYFENIEKGYILKRRGFLNESFLLINQDGLELLALKPNLKWNKMNYEYQITTSDQFEGYSYKELLLMTSVHCANYYMAMMAAVIC